MSVLHAGAPSELWSSPASSKKAGRRKMKGDQAVETEDHQVEEHSNKDVRQETALFRGVLKHKRINQDGLFSWEGAEHILAWERGFLGEDEDDVFRRSKSKGSVGHVVFSSADLDTCNIKVYMSDVKEVQSYGEAACRFNLILRSKRTHSFLAPTPQLCQAWVEVLREHVDTADETTSLDLNGTWGETSVVTAGPLGMSLPIREEKTVERSQTPTTMQASHGNAVFDDEEDEEAASSDVEESVRKRSSPRGVRSEGKSDREDRESLHEEKDMDSSALVRVDLDLPAMLNSKKKKKSQKLKKKKRIKGKSVPTESSVTRSTASSLAKSRSVSRVPSANSASSSPKKRSSVKQRPVSATSRVETTTRTRPASGKASMRSTISSSPRLRLQDKRPGKPSLRSSKESRQRVDLSVICREQAAEIAGLKRQIQVLRASSEDSHQTSSLTVQGLVLQVEELRAELEAVRLQRDSMEQLLNRMSAEHARLKKTSV